MGVSLDDPVNYTLKVGKEEVALNGYLGKKINIGVSGEIFCDHCGRKTKKSFSQGYCYPCMTKLAACDSCIMSPEKCHFSEGTCREPEWGERFCMQDHYVYLANSSGLKVGITRGNQIPIRWIDQGAVQAIPIYRVASRHLSGVVEVAFKEFVNDRTNWRAMLKGQVDLLDMGAERDRLLAQVGEHIATLKDPHSDNYPIALSDEKGIDIRYPVLEYPTKITSLNLDKTPEIEGTLLGIKGQYLILDIGCINLRKYTSYHATVCAE